MANILLVEDDARTREAMNDLLSLGGHSVIEAVDGEQGVQMVREHIPDVVLLDFSLPKMHGWAVARELRNDEQTRHIPIVAMTAHVMVATEETASEAGCDAYLTKPITLDTFDSWFANFLADHQIS